MKSKYDELRECLVSSKMEYNKYKTEAYHCAKNIYEKLQEYFKIPIPCIQVIPIGEDQNLDNVVTLSESLILLDDYFWHFGIAIILYENENVFPHDSIQIHLQIKKGKNGFEARIGDESPLKRIETEEEMIIFLDYVFKKIKEEYTNSIETLSELGVSTRKIGFKTSKDE